MGAWTTPRRETTATITPAPLNSLGLLYESLGRAGVIVAVVSLLGVVQAPMVVRLEVHLLGSRLQLQPLLHQLAHRKDRLHVAGLFQPHSQPVSSLLQIDSCTIDQLSFSTSLLSNKQQEQLYPHSLQTVLASRHLLTIKLPSLLLPHVDDKPASLHVE